MLTQIIDFLPSSWGVPPALCRKIDLFQMQESMMINSLNPEVDGKLEFIRKALTETGAIALRLRGTDWFAWASPAVPIQYC